MKREDRKTMLMSFLFFVPFLVLAYLLTLVFFMIVAAVYTLFPLNASVLPGTTVVITVAVLLAVAFFAGRTGSAPGWFSGGIFALLYGVIMCLAGVIFSSIALFSLKTLAVLISCFLVGAFGGILGINTRPRPRRRGYYVR